MGFTEFTPTRRESLVRTVADTYGRDGSETLFRLTPSSGCVCLESLTQGFATPTSFARRGPQHALGSGFGRDEPSALRYLRFAQEEIHRQPWTSFYLFIGLFEFGDDREVFERCGVAFDFAVGCEFAEQTAHDLA